MREEGGHNLLAHLHHRRDLGASVGPGRHALDSHGLPQVVDELVLVPVNGFKQFRHWLWSCHDDRCSLLSYRSENTNYLWRQGWSEERVSVDVNVREY